MNERRDMGVRKGEEGMVLLLVVLLVVMFSGLGLLAMRYTRGELRSAGAFLDSAQAAEAAQTAIFILATDLRRNWRLTNSADTCPSYYQQFQIKINEAVADDSMVSNQIYVGFSDAFNLQGDCSHAETGSVPISQLQGTTPLAATPGLLSSGFANVTLTQTQPVLAPPPPGYSSDDEARNFAWYYFNVRSVARYGPEDSDADNPLEATYPKIVRGFAEVRADMKIGPIDAIAAN